MNALNKKAKKQIVRIDFDQNIYTLKAIKRAISDFSNRASSTIENTSHGVIRVLISPLQNKLYNFEDIDKDFKQLVSDHQINLEVEDDFKAIRQIIVAQAFFPCDNLEKIIDEINHDRKI